MPDTNLVVLRNGEPVVELGDDVLRDTYSVTKPVVSTLAGIALRREATRPETAGGPPEHRPYGFLWWIGRGSFGAGHLGQLLWVSGDTVLASNTGEAFVP